MPVEFRSYEGTPQYVKGAPLSPRRDAIKKTLKATVRTFQDLGRKALNAADFERTMSLPVGKGRLACDPETGEFDEDTPRKVYSPSDFPVYPMMLHSTITEGEHITVSSDEEKAQAISTRKWSVIPLEKKRRFTLTPEDTLVNLQAQLHGERARGLEMERRLEAIVTQGNPEVGTQLGMQLAEETRKREELEARLERLMALMEAKTAPEQTGEEDPGGESESSGPQSRGRRVVKAA